MVLGNGLLSTLRRSGNLKACQCKHLNNLRCWPWGQLQAPSSCVLSGCYGRYQQNIILFGRLTNLLPTYLYWAQGHFILINWSPPLATQFVSRQHLRHIASQRVRQVTLCSGGPQEIPTGGQHLGRHWAPNILCCQLGSQQKGYGAV